MTVNIFLPCRYKRNIALGIVCGAGEASCLNTASKYFKKWMEDSEKNP